MNRKHLTKRRCFCCFFPSEFSMKNLWERELRFIPIEQDVISMQISSSHILFHESSFSSHAIFFDLYMLEHSESLLSEACTVWDGLSFGFIHFSVCRDTDGCDSSRIWAAQALIVGYAKRCDNPINLSYQCGSGAKSPERHTLHGTELHLCPTLLLCVIVFLSKRVLLPLKPAAWQFGSLCHAIKS